MKRLLILTFGLLLTHLCAIAQLTEQQQIQKLNYVYQQIRNNYVDDVPLEPLVEEAIKATLKELDPHSTYLSCDEMISLRTRLRGEFAGVGIRYIVHNDTIVVRGTIRNSPAEQAKVRPNDRIVAINGRNAIGIESDSVSVLLRGDVGSHVDIDIVRRSNDKQLNIKLKRASIESSAITASYRIGDVGYISISKFSNPLAAEFLTSYRKLGNITSLIVDLRDNGGGVITSAIDLSGLFLKKGDIIVSTTGRTNDVVYDKKKDGQLSDIPLVVIINEQSASASEIFAGAIQDHDRGVIVGHTSYGKGLVQKVIDLKDGSGVSLTIARYKTPSGRIIQRPYSMGKGDEYKRDTLRYMHPDSIPHVHQALYTTLKYGRKVYGGGGITPDVYINTDSVMLSKPLAKAYSEAIFEHTDVDIWDKISTKDIVTKYPTVEDFGSRYVLDDQIMELFYNRAGLRSDDLTPIDHAFIKTMILAAMAERLYGNNARHYIYNIGFDSMAQRALDIATDTKLYSKILGIMD